MVKVLLGVVVVVATAVAVWLVRPLFVDEVVDEDFPASAGAVVPDGMSAEEVESEMAAAAASPAVEAVEDMPGVDAVALSTGPVTGADDAHQGAGTATAYELADGSRILRLEDLEVTNGPQLHVYLAPIDGTGVPDVDAAGAVDLGPLKGNVGNQNYDIPAGVDLDRPTAVVVWCVPFRVTFATAVLS